MSLKTPILIFCRIKPHELQSSQETQDYTINKGLDKDILAINIQSTNSAVFNHKPDSYSFQFSSIFDQKTSQESVYEIVAKPIVQSTLKGYNGTIFAYGQTGSGKTYTITGNQESYGIIPRALHDIFDAINTVNREKFEIQMSYLEIYNEHSNDLLNRVENKKISLREGCDKVFEWHNLHLHSVTSFSGAMDLLESGDKNRIVGDTPMNVFSSRSHTILTIYLTSQLEESLEVRRAKLNLVDLAGSERVHKTGEEGIVLEEARHINLSLHYLQQVIIALSDSSRTHVPYRNCALTSALRDSLGGNCMTAMVANIALNKANIEETVSTCRFAQRVSLVSNEVSVNLEKDLKEENKMLKEEIRQLQNQCAILKLKVQETDQTSLTPNEELLKTESKSLNGIKKSQQLQSDIIYLIEWLQDELKAKQNAKASSSEETSLTIYSVLSTVEQDERFDSFAATMEDKEEWFKIKEEEQKAADAFLKKVDVISSVHQEILNWWKHHEKSLIREMLSCRPLNILNADSAIDLGTEVGNQPYDRAIESLLQTHSELLKDIQLLKSRFRSIRRSLQRIERKYLVEYNNWKKVENLSSKNLPKLIKALDNMDNTCKEENVDIRTKHCSINYHDGNKEKSFKPSSNKIVHNYLEGLNCDDKEQITERFSMYDDTNTTFSEMNDSIFSTSTLISIPNNNVAEQKLMPEPRAVRSVPGFQLNTHQSPRCCYTISTYNQPPSRPLSMPTFHLTGDKDIDDEIVAFYQNKCKH